MKQTATGMSRLRSDVRNVGSARCKWCRRRENRSGGYGGISSLRNPEDGQAVETEWKKMDQALPESSGTGQASEDMENEVFYKTFFTHENCRIKKSIFNFVYVKTEQTAKL